jgi:hypothetical protein
LGVPQDYAEAARWYRKAADQGNAHGQNYLGELYINGLGVPQDYAEAARWFRKAADQGLALAQHNLGRMYDESKGVWQPKQKLETQIPRASAARTPLSKDAELKRQRVSRVQRQLTSLGFDAGVADGQLGPKTRAAIRAFEAHEGMPVTGAVSQNLEDALRSASLAIPKISPPPPAR